MEKTVKLWQVILGTITLILTIGSAFVNQSNKIETQRLRIEFLESSDRDRSLQIRDLSQQWTAQYKEMNQKLTDILVTLQNKEDRQKN